MSVELWWSSLELWKHVHNTNTSLWSFLTVSHLLGSVILATIHLSTSSKIFHFIYTYVVMQQHKQDHDDDFFTYKFITTSWKSFPRFWTGRGRGSVWDWPWRCKLHFATSFLGKLLLHFHWKHCTFRQLFASKIWCLRCCSSSVFFCREDHCFHCRAHIVGGVS